MANSAPFYVSDGDSYTVTTTWERVVEAQEGRTFLKILNTTSAAAINIAFGGGRNGPAAAALRAGNPWTPQASFPLAANGVYEPVNVPADDIWVQIAAATGTVSVWSGP
jgi:hypothetical protein